MQGLRTTDCLEGHVALYGGSFDPPHLGHQVACLYLLEGLGADAVWLVPVGRHGFDKPLTDGPTRLRWTRELARPFGERVRVDAGEMDRDEVSRTYNTWMRLKEAHPHLSFVIVIGEDNLPSLSRWAQADALRQEATFVVLRRRTGQQSAPEVYSGQTAPASPLIDVSSTDIRRRVRDGAPIRGLVPVRVAAQIQQMGLYRGPDA